MNIIGIIPARGQSKGIIGKNLLQIDDKPLISYTVEKALESKHLNKIAISSDSEIILDTVRKLYEVDLVKRPTHLARDDSPIEEALIHTLEILEREQGYRADIVVWMQPNVPIRKHGVIDTTIENLLNSPDADSSVTCYEVTQIPEAMKKMNDKGRLVPLFDDVMSIRRQEFEKRFLLDGSVNTFRAHLLFNNRGVRKIHVYLGKEIIPVVQKKRMYSLELDELEDVSLLKHYWEQYVLEEQN